MECGNTTSIINVTKVIESLSLDNPDILKSILKSLSEVMVNLIGENNDLKRRLEGSEVTLDSLRNSVEDKIKNGIEEEFRESFENKIMNYVVDTLQKKFEENIRNNIEVVLNNNLEDKIKNIVEDTLQKNFEETIRNNVDVLLKNNLKDKTKNVVGDTLQENFKEKLRDNLEVVMKNNFEDKIIDIGDDTSRNSYADEICNGIDGISRNIIGDQIRHAAEDALQNNVEIKTSNGMTEILGCNYEDKTRYCFTEEFKNSLADNNDAFEKPLGSSTEDFKETGHSILPGETEDMIGKKKETADEISYDKNVERHISLGTGDLSCFCCCCKNSVNLNAEVRNCLQNLDEKIDHQFQNTIFKMELLGDQIELIGNNLKDNISGSASSAPTSSNSDVEIQSEMVNNKLFSANSNTEKAMKPLASDHSDIKLLSSMVNKYLPATRNTEKTTKPLFSIETKPKDLTGTHKQLKNQQYSDIVKEVCKVSPEPLSNCQRIVAIACEIVGVKKRDRKVHNADMKCGLVHCTVVDYNLKILYHAVITYGRDYPGIHPDNAVNVVSVQEARKKLTSIMQDKVIVGHNIVDDLALVKISWPRKKRRDTSQCSWLNKKAGFSQQGNSLGLSKLSRLLLGKSIPEGKNFSMERALATMKLYKLVAADWEKEF